jgi:hypothetical protein
MRVTAKKDGILVSFYNKLAIFDKTVGITYGLSENLKFLKTLKNSYMRSLCITVWIMGVTAKKYRISVNFWRKLMIFSNSVGYTYEFSVKI